MRLGVLAAHGARAPEIAPRAGDEPEGARRGVRFKVAGAHAREARVSRVGVPGQATHAHGAGAIALGLLAVAQAPRIGTAVARGVHAPPNLFRARYASLRLGVAANALVGEKLALARKRVKRVPAQHAFERDARGDVFVHGQVSDSSRVRFSATSSLAGGAIRQQAVPAPQVGRVRGDPQRPQIRVLALWEAHGVPRDVPARAAQHVRARVRREGDGRAEALRVRATQETFRRVRRAGRSGSSRSGVNDIVHVIVHGFRTGH